MSTVDSQRGLVVLHVPPGCEGEVGRVIGGLLTVMPIVAVCPG